MDHMENLYTRVLMFLKCSRRLRSRDQWLSKVERDLSTVCGSSCRVGRSVNNYSRNCNKDKEEPTVHQNVVVLGVTSAMPFHVSGFGVPDVSEV